VSKTFFGALVNPGVHKLKFFLSSKQFFLAWPGGGQGRFGGNRMLKFLSRRKRSRKVLLWGFIILLALGLIGIFTPAWSGLQGSANDDSVVAEVGDYEVTVKELRQALTAFGQQMAAGQGAIRQDDPNMTYALYGTQIIDSLVRQKVILLEADHFNIKTTDQEVQERLKQMFNPWPGAEQYRAQIRQAGMTPVQFEESIRSMIAEQKLRTYITAAAQVSPAEVEEEYRRNNTQYTVRWAEVTADKLRDKVAVNDADLRAYFDEHKSEFRINTEQRRARYLFVDQAKAGESIQVSDDELRQDFNPERGVKQARVSQIVLNIPKSETTTAQAANRDASAKQGTITNSGEDTPEDKVRKKAEEIVTRLKGAEGKPGEDFAKLARELSEDAKSRAQGGDIGLVSKDDKRDSDDPLNRVFSMQKDEVSPPVRKNDKYYILKVTDRRLPTFEESRAQLLKEARARKGYTRAVEIATEAAQKFKESKNAETTVAEINQKHGSQVASVKETQFFAEGDALADLGAAAEFQKAVFELQNPGDIGNHMNVNNGLAVPQYLEKRDPHDPQLEEVKKKVEDRYRGEKSKGLAEEAARKISQAQTPDAMKAAADAAGIKTEERASIPASDSIGPLVSEANRAPIYKLQNGQVTREPIEVEAGNSYVVAALVNRKDADMGEAFQKERKSIEERLLDSKRSGLFQAYLAETQKQLKSQNKIKVFQEVIESALTNSAVGQGGPQQPGGMPAGAGRNRPRRRTPTGQ
jgi:peptidyl-prolyl cis-trans isomerase D